MSRSHFLAFCLSLALSITAKAEKQHIEYFVTDLGVLPGSIANQSEATAINNQGEIVGNSFGIPFIYRDGNMTDLRTLVTSNPSNIALDSPMTPTGINDAGTIVGTAYLNGSGQVGFTFSNGILTTIASPSPQTGSITITSVNGLGQTLGCFGDSSCFIYSQGIFTNILPGDTIDANGINNAGQIAGALLTSSGASRRAFIYEKGAPHFLGTITGFTGNSEATAINARGDAAGWIQATTGNTGGTRPMRAFLYSHGKMINLGLPDDDSTAYEISASALNNKGSVVGQFYHKYRGTNFASFVYAQGKMKTLDNLISKAVRWHFYNAVGINDSGLIVGQGSSKTGDHAYVLTPVPTVKINGPARVVVTRSRIVLRGSATGNPYQVITTVGHHSHHNLRAAIGTNRWHASFALHKGLNYLNVAAIVPRGSSSTQTVVVDRK